jgi:hypothetical protein
VWATTAPVRAAPARRAAGWTDRLQTAPLALPLRCCRATAHATLAARCGSAGAMYRSCSQRAGAVSPPQSSHPGRLAQSPEWVRGTSRARKEGVRVERDVRQAPTLCLASPPHPQHSQPRRSPPPWPHVLGTLRQVEESTAQLLAVHRARERGRGQREPLALLPAAPETVAPEKQTAKGTEPGESGTLDRLRHLAQPGRVPLGANERPAWAGRPEGPNRPRRYRRIELSYNKLMSFQCRQALKSTHNRQ